MTTEDHRALRNRFIALMCIAIPFEIFFIVMTWKFGEDFKYAGPIASALLLGFFWFLALRYKAAKKEGKKLVIKGVITSKHYEEGGQDDPSKYHISISGKRSLEIDSWDYKKITYGDIVMIERVDDDFVGVGNKISIIGKIPVDVPEARSFA